MYSLSKAVTMTGKSKATISKAIRSKRLVARKDERGRYMIDPEDLAKVYQIVGLDDLDEQPANESSQIEEAGQVKQIGTVDKVDQQVETGQVDIANQTDDPGQMKEAGAVDREIQIGAAAHVKEPNQINETAHVQDAVQIEEVGQVKETGAVEEANQQVETEQVDKASQTDDPGQLKEPDAVDKATQIREAVNAKESTQINEMAHVQKAVQAEEVDQVDQEVAETASDDTPFPQVELMHLRDQLSEVTAELRRQREYSPSTSDRFGAQMEREGRHIAEQIKGVVEATLDHRSDQQMVKLANEYSGIKPTGAHPEAVSLAPELAALQSVLDDVRADLRVNCAAIERIEAKTDTRQGTWMRGLTALALGWGVMSGVYIAGFWVQFGAAETVRYGQISYTALLNLLLSFWPF